MATALLHSGFAQASSLHVDDRFIEPPAPMATARPRRTNDEGDPVNLGPIEAVIILAMTGALFAGVYVVVRAIRRSGR